MLLFELEIIFGFLNMPEPMAQNNFDKLLNFVLNAAKAVAEIWEVQNNLRSMTDAATEIKKFNLMLWTHLYQ